MEENTKFSMAAKLSKNKFSTKLNYKRVISAKKVKQGNKNEKPKFSSQNTKKPMYINSKAKNDYANLAIDTNKDMQHNTIMSGNNNLEGNRRVTGAKTPSNDMQIKYSTQIPLK